MFAESFQQHKTSFFYHKFPSPFWEELSAKQTERAIHSYKEMTGHGELLRADLSFLLSNLREWGRFLRESLCLSPDGYVIIWS